MLDGQDGCSLCEVRFVQFGQIVVLFDPKPEILAEIFSEAVDGDGLDRAALSPSLCWYLGTNGGLDGDGDQCKF